MLCAFSYHLGQAHSDRHNPRVPYGPSPEPFLIQPPLRATAVQNSSRRNNPSHTPPQTSSLRSVSPAHQKQTILRAERRSALSCGETSHCISAPCLKRGCFAASVSCSRGMCMLLCLITTEERGQI